MTDKERYYYRKECKLCVRCGEPKGDTPTVMCNKCNQEQKEEVKYLKKHNICVSCRINNAAPNRTLCDVCLCKRLETYRKKKENTTEEEALKKLKKRREQHKKRVETRKENGLCTRCGKKALEGHILCIDCNLKNNKSSREYRANQHEPKMPDECLRCSNKKLPGRQLCEKHYNLAVKSLEKGRNSIAGVEAHKKYGREKIDMFWSEMKYYGSKKPN